MKKLLVGVLSFAFLLLGDPAAPQTKPPELAAEMFMYSQNKPFDEGKFYITQNGIRLDLTKQAKQTHIFRWDADKIEAWIHDGKMIMEMKMQYNALVNYKPAGFSEQCGGTEVIEGHPCDKCVMTGTFLGKRVKSTVWKAKDLKGLVIKNMDDEGNGTILKNIAPGPQPPSLLNAPADYQRMQLPGGFGDLIKGMAE